ncbi:MAG: hypothetical protein P8P83_02990 [Rickettsiaceae bacterium]|nr:hypothetical protein [Rickettsiaceae bacterium]
MKLIRFLVISIVLILSIIGGGWYYVMNKVTNDLNTQYAGQKIAVNGMDKKEYFVTFDKLVPSGFPFKISIDVQGWKEESRASHITYPASIQLGYDLLFQQLFVSYDGEIIAAYKPVSHGFGSKIEVKDYKIKADLPISYSLIRTLKNLQDPIQILNHLGDISIGTGEVKAFDLIDNEKYYDKEYENFSLTFTPQKEYKNLEDLLSNIPQHYAANYDVKIHPTKAVARRLPVSLFYGFSLLPSGFDMKVSANVSTNGNNLNEISKNLNVQLDANCDSPYLKVSKFKADYRTGDNIKTGSYVIDTSANIFIKKNMFDRLFDYYEVIAPNMKKSTVGAAVNREIQYIISNKQHFKFNDIEDNEYQLHLAMNSSDRGKAGKYIIIDDLNISSEKSGIKLQHEMEYNLRKGKSFWANGLLQIKNYPSVVDFTSGYVYRFGKFKKLSEEARKLYIQVNTEFLKNISDNPKEVSNDVSFKYKLDSNNLSQSEFGSARVDKIAQLYSAMLYKNLLGKVGYEGDVLAKMQKIIPFINKEDPVLKQVLPLISRNKSLDKTVQKQLDKVLPPEAKDIIGKLIPKNKMKGNDFFKTLTK